MKGKNISIIGGTSFIGTNFIKKFHNEFDLILSISKNPAKFKECNFPENVVFIDASLTKQDLIDVFKKYQIKYLIDLAYSTVPKTSFDDPLNDISSNLYTTVNIFEWVKDVPLEKIIWISTGGAIYGHTNDPLIKETHPTNPISPYGITKLALEKYAYMYYKIFNTPIVCLRPSNAFGPYQQPYRGQGFVATAIASILQEKPITIFGEKGTVRDYIFIDDLINAIMLSLDNGVPGEIYNIGTEKGINNIDILNLLLSLGKKVNKTTEVIIKPERPFDVAYNVLDSSKFKKCSNWKVKYNFNEGLTYTWNWYVNNLK